MSIMDLLSTHVIKVLSFVFVLGAVLSQDYFDYPTYSEDNLPSTSFSCKDKILGGYYADIETDCQMYHVCSKNKFGQLRSTRFLCGNSTVFDQRHLVCQDYRKVQRCQDSARYYRNHARYFRNPASILELVDARLRSENKDKDIVRPVHFDTRGVYSPRRVPDSPVEDYDYPALSEYNLPETSFSCRGKVNGGYYADIETDCQMYHVCSKDKTGRLRSTRFLCGNGTVFDQVHLVCQDYGNVMQTRCKDSERYYRKAKRYHRTSAPGMTLEKRGKEILAPVRVDSRGVYSSHNVPDAPLEDDDYPTYSEDNLPATSFSCRDKVDGGYYADIETDCQMYHVCSKNKFGELRSTRFLCGNGTVFDQRHLVCQDYGKVHGCKNSPRYYRNSAAILELREASLRSARRDKEISDARQFDSGRL